MNELFGTVSGGVALATVALVVRQKLPGWTGLRTVLMLAAGFAALTLISKVLSVVVANGATTGWAQALLQWIGHLLTTIPKAGPLLDSMLGWVATALPWIVACVLAGIVIIDMFPRLNGLRGGSGGGRGPGGGGGMGGRLASLHEAREHTGWVALFAPAAVALVPPLAHLLRIGG